MQTLIAAGILATTLTVFVFAMLTPRWEQRGFNIPSFLYLAGFLLSLPFIAVIGAFTSSVYSVVITGVLVPLLVVATWTDARQHRIPSGAIWISAGGGALVTAIQGLTNGLTLDNWLTISLFISISVLFLIGFIFGLNGNADTRLMIALAFTLWCWPPLILAFSMLTMFILGGGVLLLRGPKGQQIPLAPLIAAGYTVTAIITFALFQLI
jgi:hypothetical protein